MESAAVNLASPNAGVSNICRRASLAGTRLQPRTSPTSTRTFAPQYTRAQAQDPSPLQQTTHSYQLDDHATLSPPPALESPLSCLTIDRDVLPGEVIDFPGVVMVKGDVHDGAAIHTTGDILVLGKLDGKAHAGSNGDGHAFIFAWKLTSTTLSIAGHETEPSTNSGDCLYKVASLSDNQVRIMDAVTKDSRFSSSKMDHNNATVRTSNDLRAMRRSSKVAAFTGLYIFIVGLVFLISPRSLGHFFDLKSSVTEWIRFIAVLAMVFGVYYIGTAWGDAMGYNGANSFYLSTIIGRVFIFLSFSWMAVNGALGFPLFVVGTVNLIGALTMFNALRKEKRQQQTG